MKKILALALSLTLALSLCACGGDTTGDTAENTDAQQIETDVVEIPEVEDLTSTDTSTKSDSGSESYTDTSTCGDRL